MAGYAGVQSYGSAGRFARKPEFAEMATCGRPFRQSLPGEGVNVASLRHEHFPSQRFASRHLAPGGLGHRRALEKDARRGGEFS